MSTNAGAVSRNELIRLCCVVALSVTGTWLAVGSNPIPPNPEAAALAQKYGPDRHSENEEEWIIRDYFQDRRDGIFLDVGAAHYEQNSNSFYLERHLGWSGLAVEPFAHFEPDYRTNRPRTRFMPFFVSDVSGEEAKMYTHGDKFLASSTDKSFVERFGKNPKEFTAPTITLNDLLARSNVDRIDFLTMDIELSEPKALAGFDIRRFQPQLVCIEAHPEVRQAILNYFAANSYVIVGKYLRIDDKNLYFEPLR